MSSNISNLEKKSLYTVENTATILMQPVYNEAQRIVDFKLVDCKECRKFIGDGQVTQNRYLSQLFFHDTVFWRNLLIFTNNDFSSEAEMAVKLQGKSYKAFVKKFNQNYVVRLCAEVEESASHLYVKESKGKTPSLYRDKLTGFYNFNYFQEILPRTLEKQRQPLGLILLTVNGLQLIYQLLGKETGDKYLKSAADLLLSIMGKKTTTLRLADDELAVLVAASSAEEVKVLVQKLRNCSKQIKEPFKTCLSVEAAFSKTGKQNLNELYAIAKYKLRQYKQKNRNRLQADVIKYIRKLITSEYNRAPQHWESLDMLLVKLGVLLGLTSKQLEDLRMLAILHDIGIVKVPKEIVLKPKKLTIQEWHQIKKHCEAGAQIVYTIPEFASVAEAILYHHERWDGCGYPRGLKGKEIPLLSRVFAVVDAFDAMTQHRVYREKISPLEALAELEKCAGKQFDPEIVLMFGSMIRREELSKRMEKEREKLKEIAATKGVNSKEALEQSKLIDQIHNELNKFKF
ncbi:MAG: diguanylate cyclase [Firmicutes bacterium]|nr:diguanylate cyclase [Bacillota bacterium]